MTINNEQELRRARDQATILIQQIHDYCRRTNRTIADVPDSRVGFPWGFIRRADYQRARFPFLTDRTLKSNIAYTLILSDTIIWLSIRTSLEGTARDMLNKLFIFLIGSIIESTTKSYLRGHCGQNFNTRLEFLVKHDVIEQELSDELAWVWEVRNRMHLFQLAEAEFENDYNENNHQRTIYAFRGLLRALTSRGVFRPECS